MAKPVGESKYGFSEEEELCEHALDELLAAAESKDRSKLHEALIALINLILAKESHAPDAHEVAEGI